MSQLGISAMLHAMMGNDETVEAFKKGVDQQISSLSLSRKTTRTV